MGLTVRFTVGLGVGFTVGCAAGFDAMGAGVEPGIFFVASMITFPVTGSVCTSIQTLFVHCAAWAGVLSTDPTKSAIESKIEEEKRLMVNTCAG